MQIATFYIKPIQETLRIFPNHQIKAFFVAIAILPSLMIGIDNITYSKENKSANDNELVSKLYPASKLDTFLYRQIGINFLCRALLAEIDFPKAVGISSATITDVITQKHGGFVEELPDKKLTTKQLYLSAEIQVIEGGIEYCPDKIPKDAKKKFRDFVKDNEKFFK